MTSLPLLFPLPPSSPTSPPRQRHPRAYLLHSYAFFHCDQYHTTTTCVRLPRTCTAAAQSPATKVTQIPADSTQRRAPSSSRRNIRKRGTPSFHHTTTTCVRLPRTCTAAAQIPATRVTQIPADSTRRPAPSGSRRNMRKRGTPSCQLLSAHMGSMGHPAASAQASDALLNSQLKSQKVSWPLQSCSHNVCLFQRQNGAWVVRLGVILFSVSRLFPTLSSFPPLFSPSVHLCLSLMHARHVCLCIVLRLVSALMFLPPPRPVYACTKTGPVVPMRLRVVHGYVLFKNMRMQHIMGQKQEFEDKWHSPHTGKKNT